MQRIPMPSAAVRELWMRIFDLGKLLDFAETYQPDTRFAAWVQSAEYMILNELETLVPGHCMQQMYMVEEFV